MNYDNGLPIYLGQYGEMTQPHQQQESLFVSYPHNTEFVGIIRAILNKLKGKL
jgi:hypothetical protein